MSKIRSIGWFCLLVFVFLNSTVYASDETTRKLYKWIQSCTTFDNEYPREKVFLHFDNAAYLEGDTLWYKAYVVRASTLRPSADMSKVLYVEMLTPDGNILERNMVKLDSLGQGQGHFDLNMPVKSGFYEVRAYTREMTNWKENSCFSRVIPVFSNKNKHGDYTELDIPVPLEERDLLYGHERPYDFGKKSQRDVRFFPEGGKRAVGTAQRMAFLITNGKGEAIPDTLKIFNRDGECVASACAEHLGMGIIETGDSEEASYAMIGKQKFDLPEADSLACSMRVDYNEQEKTWDVIIQRNALPMEEVGIALFYHEHPVWFNTSLLDPTPSMVQIPDSTMRYGVNRIEVFDIQGRSLGSRAVFQNSNLQRSLRPKVTISQNAVHYDPFSPIAIQVAITDSDGHPVKGARFSVSVRDDEGELVGGNGETIDSYLQLSSDLEGYVHMPESYFMGNTPSHRLALDLLMMVQGWQPQSFESMCGSETFTHEQPIEEALTIRGQVICDNERQKPRKDTRLNLNFYSQEGSFSGKTLTDSLGKFTFVSNDDYYGPHVAQFTVRDRKQKYAWSRIKIDQWFGPSVRKYNPLEMTLLPPTRWWERTRSASDVEKTEEVPLFEWEDTIPDLRRFYLSEAVVKAERINRYRGLNFNRYTYGGGEKAGFIRMNHYINAEIELERQKDKGRDFARTHEFLCHVIRGLEFRENTDDAPTIFETLEQERKDGQQERKGMLYGDTEEKTFNYQSTDIEDLERAVRPLTFGFPIGPNMTPKDLIFYRGDKLDVSVNNYSGGVGTNAVGDELERGMFTTPEELKSIMLAIGYFDYNFHLDNRPVLMPIGTMYLYTRPDWYLFRQKKGISKRIVNGFLRPLAFPLPNYRAETAPNPTDFRRTLYWNPSMTTDEHGTASAVFFSNARPNVHLHITVRGMTPDGQIIECDR